MRYGLFLRVFHKIKKIKKYAKYNTETFSIVTSYNAFNAKQTVTRTMRFIRAGIYDENTVYWRDITYKVFIVKIMTDYVS